MKRSFAFVSSVAGLLLGAGVAVAASEQTFTVAPAETWEAPQATLPAGDYRIDVQDRLSDRGVFRIKGAKDGKVYATFLAVPAKSRADSPFSFYDSVGGVRPIRAWSVPGETRAWEFVYPKDRAVEIATAVKTPVPAVDLSSVNATQNRFLSPTELRAVQLWMLTPEVVAGETKIAGAKIGRIMPDYKPKASQPVASAAPETSRLPHTATDYPLSLVAGVSLTLLGLLSLRSFASARQR